LHEDFLLPFEQQKVFGRMKRFLKKGREREGKERNKGTGYGGWGYDEKKRIFKKYGEKGENSPLPAGGQCVDLG